MGGSVPEKRITSDILRNKALGALVRSAVAVDQDGNTLDLQLDSIEANQPEAGGTDSVDETLPDIEDKTDRSDPTNDYEKSD